MSCVLLGSYYYKPHIGGVENSLHFLSQEYKRRGEKVVILVSDAGIGKSQRLLPYEEIEGIPVYRFRHFIPWISLFYVFTPLYDVFSAWFALRKLVKSHKISRVIVRHHILALASSLLFPRVHISYLIPGIVREQNSLELFRQPQSIRAWLMDAYRYVFIVTQLSYMQRLAMNRVNKLYVFSELMRVQTNQFLGFNKAARSLHMISPGVDVAKYSSVNADLLALREQVGIEKDDYVFLSLGRITVHKGLDMAVNAFFILQEKYKDKAMKLLIVGDGPELPALKLLVGQLGLHDRIVFNGKTSFPEKFYALANVFMMTSVSETFGQTIIEAMASGLPVIGFKSSKDVSTATEQLVVDNIHGTLCNYDVNELALAMEKYLLMDQKYREVIAIRNRSHIMEHYSWGKLVDTLSSH